MAKVFQPHYWRLREARPDLVETPQQTSGNTSNQAVTLPFGKIKRVGPPPQPKLRNELYFSHTSGVEQQEVEAILGGISTIMLEMRSRIKVKNFGAFCLNDGPFGNSDWYQKQAILGRQRGYGSQINADTLDILLRREPYQIHTPHMDVMVFDRDMTTGEPDNNFIYGAAAYPNYVMSVKRIRERIRDQGLRRCALAVMAAHELGHNFGLVERNFNWVDKLGSHCNGESGPCVMEQVDVAGSRTLEDQTRVLRKRTNLLCSDCLDEANYKKEHLEERGVIVVKLTFVFNSLL